MAGGDLFRPQAREDEVEEGKRPTPLEKLIRAEDIRGFQRITLLRSQGVQGNQRAGPAPLTGPGFIPFVGQESLEGDEQERAETALGLVGCLQILTFQAALEKRLHEILRI